MTNLKEKKPKTLLEAINILAADLSNNEKEFIRGNDSGSVHHFAGMCIRNEWGLWKKDSPIVQDIKSRYGLFGHGDDCSGLILAGLWAKVKGEDVEKTLQAEAQKYISHWKRYGLNPKTGEEIKGFKGQKNYSILVDKTNKDTKVPCGVCKKPIKKGQTWCEHCGANDEDE